MSITFRPLKAEEVEVRVGTCNEKGASLLLYKDARVDMKLLDEVVGPENWECCYESIDGKLFCTVTIYIKRDPDDKWASSISKQDTGTPSNMEAQKGEASDAFKRACFKWGIGRELYSAPFIWVPSDKCSIRKGRNGKPQCYDDFRVTEMEVEDGEIVKLTVANMSRRGLVVYGTAAKDAPEGETAPHGSSGGRYARISELKQAALDLGIKEEGIRGWLDAKFGKPMSEFTDEELAETERYMAQLVEDKRGLVSGG